MRVEDVNISNVGAGAPVDYTSVEGDNLLVGFRLGATYDTRDSVLRATEGGLLDISYEECTGEHTFPLANIDYNQYFTIYQRADGSGRQVLALRSAVGLAGDNTPEYERYFAGGFQSMRGFEFRGVGPDVNGFKVGGDFHVPQQPGISGAAGGQGRHLRRRLRGQRHGGEPRESLTTTAFRPASACGSWCRCWARCPSPWTSASRSSRRPTDNTQVFSFWLGFFR